MSSSLPNVETYQLGNGGFGTLITSVQDNPATATVTATLSVAQITAGQLNVIPGGATAAVYTLPTGTEMDTAFPNFKIGSFFEFAVCNQSTVAAESSSIATGTGWTLVGNVTIAANNAITTISSGIFRARKTGVGAWTLTRRA